jgi:hypothetical protein
MRIMDSAALDFAMRAIAVSMGQPFDRGEALDRIVRAARETVPGADQASITMLHRDGTLETLTATSTVIYRVDQLQYELREGPCYDAVTNGPVTYSTDLANDASWPNYGPKAAAAGLASQMAIRLEDTRKTVAGLNLYSYRLRAFPDGADVAQLFASHAAVALGYARQVIGLSHAVETRTVIGTAIGLTMERYGLTNDRAFEFLIRLSQTSNVKLRDMAARIVDDANISPT